MRSSDSQNHGYTALFLTACALWAGAIYLMVRFALAFLPSAEKVTEVIQ